MNIFTCQSFCLNELLLTGEEGGTCVLVAPLFLIEVSLPFFIKEWKSLPIAEQSEDALQGIRENTQLLRGRGGRC